MSNASPTADADEAAAYYRNLLKPVISGRRFLLIGGPVIGLAPLARSFKALGAEEVFLLGGFVGTGELPEPELARWHAFGIRAASVMEEFARYEALLRDLPEPAREALDRWDPERRALTVGAIVLSNVPAVGGRRRYGGRPPLWAALEDKIAIEEFWSDLGLPRAPSRIVSLEPAALAEAARRLDRGAGCVWAGDARDGIHGGAEVVRWVRDAGQAREALDFFRTRCDRVRVMPFLEGIPCSIHGIVFPESVAAFRPVEIVTLRRPGSSRFAYCGIGSFWDPPAADREAMRALARRVGRALRERLGYRGPFTIDGVLSEEGFLPTELNPRFGAGLGTLASAVPTLPLPVLSLAVLEGEELDYRPEWLEHVVVQQADRSRSGRGLCAFPDERTESESYQIVRVPDGYRLARGDEAHHGTLGVGPGPLGGFVLFGPDPAHIPQGASFAPYVADAFALADRELGTRVGEVLPARPAR